MNAKNFLHQFYQQSLDGVWKATWFDGQRGGDRGDVEKEITDLSSYIDAVVPGEIHLDLMREGMIPDPALDANCLAARWVEECIWSYRRTFEVSPEAASAARSWLTFEGLDYAAEIILNGERIGTHANFFSPCRIETTGKLRPGVNFIVVHLDGGLFAVSEKPVEGYRLSLDAKLHKRIWLRKPQSQFSWDWSPRLINVGIFKSVHLDWTDDPVRLERLVPIVQLADDLQKAVVKARVLVEGLAKEAVAGVVKVSMPGLEASFSKEVQIQPGLAPYEVEFEVSDYELWWPIGQGAQPLYAIQASLEAEGRTIGETQSRVGFRSVHFNQSAHPEGGNYFILEINGRKIFSKGANFVPADFIFARIDQARYRKLVDLAIEANFNFLRVWGGGLYESDEFYDLCDERGILVWQEFIFACARYPGNDPEFLVSVEEEATHQIRRLAAHPSLVAWCGNNEMQWQQTSKAAWRNGVTLPDYGLFHLVLPRLVAEEDPGRYYQPSSPYSPDITQHPNADECGDQHPWGLGFSDTDFRQYRNMICRFPNEGGILGPTSMPTMLACLPEGQRRYNSLSWMVHENSIAPAHWVNPHSDNIYKQWLDRDIHQMTLEDYVYWGGLLQGEGFKEYCENFRRRMYDCAAAIFWMFNDCWPAVRSWTIVDYYLRRTPAFYFVRRAMQPLHVVITEDEEKKTVTIHGVNDTPNEFAGSLRYGVFRLDGKYLMDVNTSVLLPANASVVIASFESSLWAQRDASMPFAILSDAGGQLISRNRLCDPFFKEMKWRQPQVSVTLKNGSAVFQSDVFALAVCIDLDGEEPLADNFFDLMPGIPYSIQWNKPTPPAIKQVGYACPQNHANN